MSSLEDAFYHLGIAPDMLQVLDKLGFKEPTPIQQKAIPIALEGKDVLGIAQTGTGKTMAFGIPTIQRLAAEGGQALILVPTRELAQQVKEALWPLLQRYKMKTAVLIGGVRMGGQLSDIRRGPDMIIATPGRLNDHIYQGTIDLGKVGIVILDEADRMLDMGFEPQVKTILSCVTNKNQTMLFSATMPADILKLATKHMNLPITVEMARSGTTVKDISQELFIVRESRKLDVLKILLEKYRGTVLIFTRTKIKAAYLSRDLKALKVKAAEIHSNRSMGQRNQAIEGFKCGRYRVLVATDIAARGIDVSMIELVINYDLPDDAENYVHRIGRTGRAGKKGHAVTLATPAQSRDVNKIEGLINMSLPRATHPEYAGAAFEKGASRGKSFGGRRSSGGSSSRSYSSAKGRTFGSSDKPSGRFGRKPSDDERSSRKSSGASSDRPVRRSSSDASDRPVRKTSSGSSDRPTGRPSSDSVDRPQGRSSERAPADSSKRPFRKSADRSSEGGAPKRASSSRPLVKPVRRSSEGAPSSMGAPVKKEASRLGGGLSRRTGGKPAPKRTR